jgi:hypothetical protein
VLDLGAVELAPGAATVHVRWTLPAGTAINDDAPFRLRWTKTDGLPSAPAPVSTTGKSVAGGYDIPLTVGDQPGALVALLDVVLCDSETHALCLPIRRRLVLAVRPGVAREVRVTAALPPAHF